jgi:hypothetical protein
MFVEVANGGQRVVGSELHLRGDSRDVRDCELGGEQSTVPAMLESRNSIGD